MEQTVGLAGLGAIGLSIAQGLDAGIVGLRLACVAVADAERAGKSLANFSRPPRLASLAEVAKADIVIEALPVAIFDDIAGPAIEGGKIFIPCSVGALLKRWHLVERAGETGARIIVPSGAVGGLDAIRAIAQGAMTSVVLETRKPLAGLTGVAYLEGKGMDVAALTKPTMVFEGNAAEAAQHFPTNANVAAAVALAGMGPEKTQVQIWADPTVTRNTHSIRVEAPSARLTVVVENMPSETNPRTSKLASLSVLACLQGLSGPIRVGS